MNQSATGTLVWTTMNVERPFDFETNFSEKWVSDYSKVNVQWILICIFPHQMTSSTKSRWAILKQGPSHWCPLLLWFPDYDGELLFRHTLFWSIPTSRILGSALLTETPFAWILSVDQSSFLFFSPAWFFWPINIPQQICEAKTWIVSLPQSVVICRGIPPTLSIVLK